MEYETEVVISGVAGSFPECANIDELEEALFRKAHLVTDDDRLGGIAKLHTGDFKYSKHSGKAFPPDKLDATFFNIPFSFPSVMDPVMKKCMETSVEAIIDAGLNPHLLEGTNTAVYSTYDNSESELVLPFTPREKVLMGNCRTLTANRLSFALNLNGPSYAFQGGCGSIFHYFDYAKRQLEERTIDAAIVVCGNCIMSDCFLAVLSGMGLSASDGKCCSFDDKAHGYALSESCVAFFLQRAEDARRNWATIVGAGNKFFGGKEPGTNFLSFDHKPAKKMLREMYIKWRVDPAEVEYVEADGSGVKDRDSREIDLISETFCKDRDKPLLIGSLKSNMGHADAAACGAGTVKALIALNKSKIPPNIHLESPNSKISPLKIQVVTDTTPFSGKYVGVNAIGLAGSFGHALLRKNSK
nr:PREDICTED: fatty acid synthase-like [Bemisia tabaci]